MELKSKLRNHLVLNFKTTALYNKSEIYNFYICRNSLRKKEVKKKKKK